jgi:cytochrome b561
MPAITRHFHEMAVVIGWFSALIIVSAIVAAVTARKYGRTNQSRKAIYSVVGFIGLVIALLITISRLRGLRFTP